MRLRRFPAAALLAILAIASQARADHVGKVVRLQTQAGTKRYALEQRLGAGWWSEVYRARSLEGGDEVAVKLLLDDRRREGHVDGNLFEHERSLNRATHPTLLRIEGIGDVEGSGSGRKAMVMELSHGKALVPNWWDHAAPRPPGKAVRIAMQVLRAARAMHQEGLKHNDIHPANVLITDERSDSVRLVDLGNATPIGESFRGGSPWYAAPEQLEGRSLDVRSDIYSAGALLAFLLHGGEPKAGELGAIPDVSAQVNGQTVRLRDVVARAMSRDPQQRYESAQAMIDALRPFSTGN